MPEDQDREAAAAPRGDLFQAILNAGFSSPLRVLVPASFLVLAHYIVYPTPEAEAGFSWHAQYLFSNLLKDFGIALYVVFGIALAVEGPARDRLERYNRKITENALESYLRTGIPPEWFEYIRSLVRGSVFIRHELRVRIAITPGVKSKNRQGGSGFVVLEQEVSYYLENRSQNSQNYVVSIYIEKPIEDRHKNYLSCRAFEIDGNQLSAEQLDAADKDWPDTSELKTYMHKITVPAKEKVHVRTVCTTVKYVRDHFVWASIHPASEIEVVCQPGEGLKAFVSILHPESLGEIDSRCGVSFSRRLKKPIMPGTAVEISWYPGLMT